MKIAICDDEKRDRENIKNFVRTHDNKHDIIEFSSAVPLMESINNGESFDVLFLDIEMPDSDGWVVAEQLKAAKVNIYIAMVTVRADYIYDCFDRVNWFVAKPALEAKIHKILNNAHDRLYPVAITFEIDKKPIVLTATEIICVEVRHNDIYILSTENKQYKIRESLTAIKKKLELPCFILVNQSCLINLDFYETIDIERNQVVLKNGIKFDLSRKQNKIFYNALREYILRKKSNGI